MKQNKKIRLIALSVVLLALIVTGGVLLLRNPTSAGGKHPVVDAPTGDPVGTGTDELIYEESLLTEVTPSGMSAIARYGDSLSVRVLDKMVAPATMEEIEPVPNTWFEQYGLPSAVAYSADNLYAVVFSADGGVQVINRDSPDNVISLPEWGGKTAVNADGVLFAVGITKLAVDSNYFYLQSAMESSLGFLQVFTRDGALYATYSDISDFDIDEAGSLYVLYHREGAKGSLICRYDVAAQTETYSVVPNGAQGEFNMLHLALEKSSGMLYVKTNLNIQTYDAASGKFRGVAMSLTQSAPSLVNRTFGMAVDREHSIYLITVAFDDAGSGDRVQLYRYRLTEDTRRDMPYTLTVTAPYRDEYLTAAITLYEKEYPDQKIKYDYAYNSLNDFYKNSDEDGYFEQTNVKLLTGDVGDVFMTGGTWSDVYHRFKAGLFADLKPMIEQDPSFSELDPAMLQGVTIDGKTCGLPLSGIYFYTEVNTALCKKLGIDLDWNNATWGDVIQLAEQLEGTDYYVFATDTPDRVFVRMLISNMPDLIDLEHKKLDLRQPWFLELLEQWKQAMQTSHLYGERRPIPRSSLAEQSLLSIDERTGGWQRDYVWTYKQINLEFGGARYAPLFSGEKHANRTAYSEDLYSIMQNSKNKEAAWQFLSFLMRRDVQQLHVLYNVKLNADVRNAEIEQAISAEAPEDQPMAKRYAEDIKNVYQSVDTFYDMNELKENLYPPLIKYLNGEMTLDDALTQAERDLWISINE